MGIWPTTERQRAKQWCAGWVGKKHVELWHEMICNSMQHVCCRKTGYPEIIPGLIMIFMKFAINCGKNIEDLGQLYLYSEGLKHVETSSHCARWPRTQRTISCSGEPWFPDGNHAARSSQWQSNLESAPCLSTCSLPIEHVIFNWRCQGGLWLVFGMIQQVM